MPRPRTSPIWLASEDKFRWICKTSKTMTEALSKFGLKNKGANYRTFKKRVSELGIDTSHFLSRTKSSGYHKRRSLKEILTKNSTYSRTHLKNRLLKEGLLEYRCYSVGCSITDTWNDKSISLQIDHINGTSDDNRIENLRLLCPNCHSQTKTFAGKNKAP